MSGGNRLRVFTVAPGARVTLSSLTVADGLAGEGGGIVNRGKLVVKGVTFTDNIVEENGGGMAHIGGAASTTNCTASGNTAMIGVWLFKQRYPNAAIHHPGW